MRYNTLGSTGLFVSELCLGTMTFGGEDGHSGEQIGSLEQSEVDRLVGAALDAGINFIDTANVYSGGRSGNPDRPGLAQPERATRKRRGGVQGHGRNGHARREFSWPVPLHIMDSVKDSLKRMQLDHLDLYQVHGLDPATPMEETLRALDTLVQQGHVRYIGVSNWAAWQIMKALGISERHGLARFESLQAYYTIAGRDLEREVVPLLRSEGVGLMVWSPLAGGLLSGKYARDQQGEEGSRRTTFDFPPVNRERAFDCVDAMRMIAQAHKASVAQIALAWLLHQPAVTTVIVGAKRIEQL